MAMPSYPSTGEKKEEEKRKHLKPVTKGSVISENKSGFLERIGGGNPGDIKTYLVSDILIPAAKNLLGDLICDGLHMLLWGSPAKKSSNGIASKISYNKYYEDKQSTTYSNRQPSEASRSSIYKIDDILITSRAGAEDAKNTMIDILDTYGQVTVADYYELVEVSSQYTDYNYGWRNLEGIDVKRTRDGFVISLPRPIPLNK